MCDDNGFELVVDNNTIIKTKHSKETYSFGYSANQIIQNKCDDYEICNITLIHGTKERNAFDHLFRMMHSTNIFENSSSNQYEALC